MSHRSEQYLKAMGVERWLLRDQSIASAHVEVPSIETNETTVQQHKNIQAVDSDNWKRLQIQVASCMQCSLHTSRKQTVFGVGNHGTDLLVIGEAPGADEDTQGEPFVGRAGKLLNAMLLAIGYSREQVFITNILKCRPPNNRDSRPEEVVQCLPYLHRQIEFIKPKVILAVGRIAAQNLLQTEETIGNIRGKLHNLPSFNIPIVATYHPAYLLRKPVEKRKSWQDLKLIKQVLLDP